MRDYRGSEGNLFCKGNTSRRASGKFIEALGLMGEKGFVLFDLFVKESGGITQKQIVTFWKRSAHMESS
jgi:hypothetical protein